MPGRARFDIPVVRLEGDGNFDDWLTHLRAAAVAADLEDVMFEVEKA